MDPSIVKLLEEDVDESMHSGADVEAFTAALNRDIGGDVDTITGPSDSATGGISQEGASRPNEVGEMRQTSGQNPTLGNQQIEQGKATSDQSKMVGGNPDVSTKLPISQTRSKMTNQQAQGVNSVSASKKAEKGAPTIPFQMLMPILRPHLDKDRDMQLQQIFSKLRSNEVTKEDFLRVIRNIVGDKMLRQAAHTVHLQMQAQATKPATTPNTNSSTSTGATSNSNPSSAPSTNPNQYSLLSQATSQQFYPGGFQAAQKVSLGQSPSPSQLQTESKLDLKGPQPMPNRPSLVSPSMQQLTRPPHQHGPQGAHTTIGMFGPSFPRPGNATPSLRTTPTSQSQGMGPGQVGQQHWRNVGTTFGPAYVKHEQPETAAVGTLQQKQTMGAGPAPTRDEFLGKLLPQRIGPGPGSGVMGPPGQVSGTGHQMSHAESNMTAASSGPHHPLSGLTKAPSKKPSVGQKKPAETCTSPPTSKKQKTGGAFHDQSIEQLNDVTAVSGVNLREEEEQLLSAPKEDSKVSEAIRRVVQEEEDKLILQKGPLHRKLMEILAKCNLKGIGNDVERCLSMCVEERLKGLIGNLVRFSKQRVDIEKTAHRIAITSDVHQHILMVNKKAKEEWDQKQAEQAEKLKKQNEAEVNTNSETEKDKDDGRGSKNVKVNKEEDDKMRATAANVAARAAVGGDDVLSKWQLMAEQARQKREGLDVGPSLQTGKSSATMPGPKFSQGSKEQQEAEKRGLSATPDGMGRPGQGGPLGTQSPKVARIISMKDVISVLEREPQMSKSTLLYQLYNKIPDESSPAANI